MFHRSIYSCLHSIVTGFVSCSSRKLVCCHHRAILRWSMFLVPRRSVGFTLYPPPSSLSLSLCLSLSLLVPWHHNIQQLFQKNNVITSSCSSDSSVKQCYNLFLHFFVCESSLLPHARALLNPFALYLMV